MNEWIAKKFWYEVYRHLFYNMIYDGEMPFCSLFADTREDWPSKGAKNLKMMMMTTAILIGLCL